MPEKAPIPGISKKNKSTLMGRPLFFRYSGVGKTLLATCIFLSVFIISPWPVNAQQNQDTSRVSNVTLGTGVFDIASKIYDCGMFEINYFAKKQFWIFSPFAGAIVTTVSSYYIYAGVVIPFRLAKGVYLNCSFAPGLWSRQDGPDLGYPLEFRTGAEICYIFRNKSRLGLEFHHISNANFSNRNPGAENITIFFGIPLK